MLLALSLPLLSAGKSRLARIAMMAITTSNSIKVKASFLLVSLGTNPEITGMLAPANAQLFTATPVARFTSPGPGLAHEPANLPAASGKPVGLPSENLPRAPGKYRKTSEGCGPRAG